MSRLQARPTHETAKYVADMSRQLAAIARRERLTRPALLLALAAELAAGIGDPQAGKGPDEMLDQRPEGAGEPDNG